MDLRRLRLFVAVVEHGGFSAAARAVHVAQPAVSLAVRELEHELGTPLVVRSRAGATPTAAGSALLTHARRALREIASAADAVAAVAGLVAGHLDVAALPTLAADPLAAWVGRFRSQYPGVTVRVSAPGDPDGLADAVRSGLAEVGITEAGPQNTGLTEVPIASQELLAVAPPDSARAVGPLALAELADVPLVVTAPGTSLRRHVEDGLAGAGVVPRVAVESAQRDALVPLVLAGAGVTLLPAALAEGAARMGAVVRSTDPPLARDVVLVHRAGAASPAADRFVAIAHDRNTSR